MSEDALERIKDLRFGDQVEVDWWDHSRREMRLTPKGKPRPQIFDVPVNSVGRFFGVSGDEIKHIILARDIFNWPLDGDFDVDVIAILIKVVKTVTFVAPSRLDPKFQDRLKIAWERGQVRVVKRGKRLKLIINKGGLKA